MSVDVTKFFVLDEGPKTGDFRQFHIYCPYIEDGRGLRFRSSYRISGTQEQIIGEIGVQEKFEKERARFRDLLLKEAKQGGRHFQIRGKQLWLVEND